MRHTEEEILQIMKKYKVSREEALTAPVGILSLVTEISSAELEKIKKDPDIINLINQINNGEDKMTDEKIKQEAKLFQSECKLLALSIHKMLLAVAYLFWTPIRWVKEHLDGTSEYRKFLNNQD